MRTAIVLALAVAVGVAVYTQITLFVVQPIGAVPDGVTAVIWRREKTNFIDSADGVCAREMQVVNLLCRGAVLGAIVKSRDDVLLRLPYSKSLYLISTGGREYDC